MRRILPTNLTGPRTYFTAFDPAIVKRTSDHEKLRQTCERKLKLLLLLKARVVCGASHLKSPIAFQIFSANPFLLNQGLVTPALRERLENIDEAFQVSAEFPAPSLDVAKFYADHVAEVVLWNVEDTSNWFRERFLEEIQNSQSIVRLNTKGLTEESVKLFVEAQSVRGTTLSRQVVAQWTRGMAGSDRDVILAFRELLYHMSGARIVNCESSLPQEEYLDFDIADLSQGRTRLTDDLIFWKIFVEQALATLEMRMIPIELLDMLSFKDIVAIRAPILDSNFQTKYDELTRSTISLARQGVPRMVESVERLESIRSELAKTIAEIFERELPRFIKSHNRQPVASLASNGVSVGLGLIGLLPGIGTLASAASLVKDSTAFFFNVADFRATPRLLAEVVQNRDAALRVIATRRPSEEAPMLEIVDLLTSIMRERIRML